MQPRRRQRSMDRIGSLPDHILCHILSSLPTKNSVATSILSSRWRSVWAHVPTLDFHFDDYGPLTRPIFPKIINRVVSLHKLQSVDTLRFDPGGWSSDVEPRTFITNAKFHKLRNLKLHVDSTFVPTRHLLTCAQTLVTLKLSSTCHNFIFMTNKDDDVCLPLPLPLPHLKELSLGTVVFKVDEDLPRFLSGCPVLEDLTLNGVWFWNKVSGCLNISSPALKRLRVSLGCNTYFSGCKHSFGVEINAPALTYLSVKFITSRRISSVSPMASLIEADIRIWMVSINSLDDGDDYECYVSMLKFLGCLCNVKCLTFNGKYDDKFVDMMMILHAVRFDNLTKLVYGFVADWRLFVKFLEIADNLQVLVVGDNRSLFGADKLSVSKPTGGGMIDDVGAHCLSSNLKSITICLMDVDKPEERNVVRYLLEKAKVVEKMKIYLRGDPGASLFGRHSTGSLSGPRSRLLKFLSSFVRGSKACKDIILLYSK